MTTALHCTTCAASYACDDLRFCCDCGGVLDLRFEPGLDQAALRTRPATLWRYAEALPLSNAADPVTLGEPVTPLVEMELAGRSVLVKQDFLYPSGSYKDRGSAVLMSRARELGVAHVVEDSSGNAGASIAMYGARAGIRCDIYVPETTSPGKLVQIERSGARLVRVPGSREDTAAAARHAAQRTFYASHCWNPYFLHGTKTFAYELCEQLDWQPPEAVVLPVGNGTLLLGAWIGFGELLAMRFIERTPKLIGVQAENCAQLARAFAVGADDVTDTQSQPTLAEGIAIAAPIRGRQILQAVRATGGALLTVSEIELRETLARLHARGFYVEPTSAAAIAGAAKWAARAAPGDRIASVLTGHGLKATDSIAALRGAPGRQ